MIQQIIIGSVFLAAVFYLTKMVYNAFSAKTCETGCGHCGVNIDVDKILEQVKIKESFTHQ